MPIDLIVEVKKDESAICYLAALRHAERKKGPHPFYLLELEQNVRNVV